MSFKSFVEKIFGDNALESLELPESLRESLKECEKLETAAKKRENSAVDYYDTKNKKKSFIVSENTDKTTGNVVKKSSNKRVRSQEQDQEQSL